MDFEVIYQTKAITSTIQRLKINLNKSMGSLLVEKKNKTYFIYFYHLSWKVIAAIAGNVCFVIASKNKMKQP